MGAQLFAIGALTGATLALARWIATGAGVRLGALQAVVVAAGLLGGFLALRRSPARPVERVAPGNREPGSSKAPRR